MLTYFRLFVYLLFIVHSLLLDNNNNLSLAKKSSSEELPHKYVELATYNCEDFVNRTKNTHHSVLLADQFRSWDNDSYLTTDEYVNWEEDHDNEVDKEMVVALMAEYDTDKDGRSSLEEYLYFVKQSDANNDDVITIEECIEYDLGKYRAAWKALNNSTEA